MRKNKLRAKLETQFGLCKDENFSIELIADYFVKKNKEGERTVSDRTCNDLDFDEFYMFADRTVSRVGQQYLYAQLRSLPDDIPDFSFREKVIDFLRANPDKRLDMQMTLSQITNDEAYYVNTLFQDELLQKPSWFFAVPVLALISLALIVLVPFYPQALVALIAIIIINFVIHYRNKKNIYFYISAIPQLLRLNRVAKTLIKYPVFSKEANQLGRSIKTIEKLNSRMRFFQLESKLEGEAGAVFWSVLEILKLIFLLEPLLLFGSLRLIGKHRIEVERVFTFVGTVDMMISITSLRKELKYCHPVFYNRHKQLRIAEVYHPLISNCVPNDLFSHNKSILLTGSNMSGKTSFIRTIGLNAISAYTLNMCFAGSFELPVMKIFSAIRINDDLINDKSYYFEEVLTLKSMMEESKKTDCLFLLDELYKGTNTIERIAAGNAVLSELNRAGNIVIVATHDIELTEMLDESYDLYHFCESVSGNSIDFDYKLKQGKLEKTNAISILELNGYPSDVITKAKNTVLSLSKNKKESRKKPFGE